MPKPPQAILLILIALTLTGSLLVWRFGTVTPANATQPSSAPTTESPHSASSASPRPETAITFQGSPDDQPTRPNTAQRADRPSPGSARSRSTASSSTPLPPPPPITPKELPTFRQLPYPAGQPATRGEPVNAYVRIASRASRSSRAARGDQSTDVALTENQAGEFPRLPAEPGETVQVRLAFAHSPPGTPVAVAAQDGGLVEVGGQRARSLAGALDEQSQLALAYQLTRTNGLHRVTVGTPNGDTKVLEFWAGELPQMKVVNE